MASYGGTVAAVSACSALQSIGAVGTFTGATAVATAGAAIMGGGAAAVVDCCCLSEYLLVHGTGTAEPLVVHMK
ncbi:hypothetical protein R1flu_013621 [Riccia fluitans]|uniref:Uncharacterized protein n=1 Tax=Riccia fluitans TaxID=41844 RepID=A0ABD1YE47_9MARC